MSAADSFDPQHFIKHLTSSPGVYQMINKAGKIIYVGKARNLKKRVASYFSRQLDTKTQVMISQVVSIEVILTTSENEALLLEANLIKSLKPRYNVLLRDDKSYPYLYFSDSHHFPRLDFYRGVQKPGGHYFGPYPSAGSVRENLALIQKLFKIRQCRDSFFAHRTRPCLQYQIKRCTGPCVGLVSEKEYAEQVEHAILFLQGKNDQVMSELTQKMELASQNKAYESAAVYRDQLAQLRRLQSGQVMVSSKGNIDIIGVYQGVGEVAASVLQVRSGRMLGQRAYFPSMPKLATTEDVLMAFIPQYYLNPVRANDLPERIVVGEVLTDRQWLQDALQDQLSKVLIISDKKLSAYRQWQQMALANAMQALGQHQAQKSQVTAKLSALQRVLNLPNPIQRIECFDVSHTQGEATKASCVVYGEQGAINKDYRQYNIKNITPGDDYAAMRQALLRRYTKVKKEGAILPDVLIIDGGKGQVQQAADVLEELQVSGVLLLGVAKGPSRKPGEETLLLWGERKEMALAADDMALHLIQFVRDEAHRFAIASHRAARGKKRTQSPLEQIEGVGAVRRQRLLKFFGGLQALRQASSEDIARVPGVSLSLAQVIYDALHES